MTTLVTGAFGSPTSKEEIQPTLEECAGRPQAGRLEARALA
jgi:hypothetical protein